MQAPPYKQLHTEHSEDLDTGVSLTWRCFHRLLSNTPDIKTASATGRSPCFSYRDGRGVGGGGGQGGSGGFSS